MLCSIFLLKMRKRKLLLKWFLKKLTILIFQMIAVLKSTDENQTFSEKSLEQ